MPMDRSRYPSNWASLSRDVRERAGWRCECRGECGGQCARASGRCEARQDRPHPVTLSRVVLTVAHLWRGACAEHHAAGVKCGDPAHLRAYCQRCHLRYDAPQHAANAARTRRARKRNLELFGDGA